MFKETNCWLLLAAETSNAFSESTDKNSCNFKEIFRTKLAELYHELSGEVDTEWRIDMLKIIERLSQVKLGFRVAVF